MENGSDGERLRCLESKEMTANDIRLQGVSASPGIASAVAFVYVVPTLIAPTHTAQDCEFEVRRLSEAASAAAGELQALTAQVRETLGADHAHIFRSQQTITEDESIVSEVAELIRSEMLCAESGLERVFQSYVKMFEQLDDQDYNKGRVADLQDVYRRILGLLLGVERRSLAEINHPCIVVAEDLLPSDTALMNTQYVRGLVTERGGATSHVAILARNIGIPAAVAVHGAIEQLRTGDSIVLQCVENSPAIVYVNPGSKTLELIEGEEERLRERRSRIESCRDKEPITLDGARIDLAVNLGSTQEIATAVAHGGTRVGLYRSEFLFMRAQGLPDEEEQFRAYKLAAEAFPGGDVIVRTLDIGGDKHVPAIALRKEDNPFLGLRALRLSLNRPMLFRTQIRAILRASAFGNVKLMFPMVGGLPELEEALEHVDELCTELRASGTPFNSDIEIGIMVEIPSAVWMADVLAKRVAFFSIGTNDLIQYLLAADRLNDQVATYYRAFDPAVFRAVKHVTQAAEAQGLWVGVCGELGANPLAIPALIGLGVSELSMSPSSLPEATWLIRNSRHSEMRALASEVLGLSSEQEVITTLKQAHRSLWEKR